MFIHLSATRWTITKSNFFPGWIHRTWYSLNQLKKKETILSLVLIQSVTDEISAYHCQSKQFFDTPKSTLTLLFMCCTLDYDKLYSVSLKDQHIERYFLYCEKSLESDPYLIFVFFPLFSSFANESSMETDRLRICKSWNGFPLKSEGFHPLVNPKTKYIHISLFMINIDRPRIVYVLS